ncbi:hypothetical protein LX32DRAFT_2439 [Colletotrichum zoysiae]|uniref:Uncharacterized protein n=1 Tax=Colletotrichum zoysiae TaxID=1216348 RepID=A0AAD9HVX8_9PEZI|nr:hypothetical protein LX32DRAFT_2439 [Colletotrichum zoysiae]
MCPDFNYFLALVSVPRKHSVAFGPRSLFQVRKVICSGRDPVAVGTTMTVFLGARDRARRRQLASFEMQRWGHPGQGTSVRSRHDGALGSATVVILECLLRNARRCDSVLGPAIRVLAGWPPEPWFMIAVFLALAWAGLWVRCMARAGFRESHLARRRD